MRSSFCSYGVVLPAVLVASLAGAVTAGGREPERIQDFIVAKVNEEIVTTADILKEIGGALDGIDRNELLSQTEKRKKKIELWTRTVRDKVEEILALQAARKLGIKVGKDELDEEYASFLKRVGGEDEARRWAKEQGITLDEIEGTLRRRLTITKLIKEKLGLGGSEEQRRPPIDSFVRPSEIQEYYAASPEEFRLEEAVKIRQIFLPWKPEREAVWQLARSIVGQLRKGADFAQLAGLYSPERLGRHGGQFPMEEENGKLVWQHVRRGVLRPEVEKAAFALEPGQVSDPVETEMGLFVLKVEERRQTRVVPFREAQVTIRARLHREKVNANLDRVRRELRSQAVLWPQNLFQELDLRFLGEK